MVCIKNSVCFLVVLVITCALLGMQEEISHLCNYSVMQASQVSKEIIDQGSFNSYIRYHAPKKLKEGNGFSIDFYSSPGSMYIQGITPHKIVFIWKLNGIVRLESILESLEKYVLAVCFYKQQGNNLLNDDWVVDCRSELFSSFVNDVAKEYKNFSNSQRHEFLPYHNAPGIYEVLIKEKKRIAALPCKQMRMFGLLANRVNMQARDDLLPEIYSYLQSNDGTIDHIAYPANWLRLSLATIPVSISAADMRKIRPRLIK